MSDVITLSSDEESDANIRAPPKKRIKPTLVEVCRKENQVVVSLLESDNEEEADTKNSKVTILDDDDDDTNELLIPISEETCDIPTGTLTSSSEKENSPEPAQNHQEIGVEETPEKSASKAPEKNDLEDYLNVFEVATRGTKFDLSQKFPTIIKVYNKCGKYHVEAPVFKKILESSTKKAKMSAADAAIGFSDVYHYLKSIATTEFIEVTEDTKKKLKKLEKTIQLLLKRIKVLEETEVDYDEEEDSSFMQLDRFGNRLKKVYNKYCQLLNRNPNSGRITYDKLVFVDSEHNEINLAINKKYKNNSKFPNYTEIEKQIRKCVEENNLGLSEGIIQRESQQCFKKIGKLLQSRRKRELYDAHIMYIKDTDDPAKTNAALNNTLKMNFEEGRRKIDDVCQEYVLKQEMRSEASIQDEEEDEEDSDNSYYVDSEAEIEEAVQQI